MLRRIDHKELPVLGDILIAVGAVVMILREQVLHIGKRQCATHQNRDAVLRNYIAPAVAVRSVELRDLLVIGLPVVSGVQEEGNAEIRRRENEEYSRNLSYPVYIVTYIAGENEDTREWTVFVMDTDICTYLYGFCAPPDAAADMGETYQNIFSQLYLSDEE